MRPWRHISAFVAVLALSGAGADAVRAASVTYGFYNFSADGSPENAASQMSVTVRDVAGQPNQVDFRIQNSGPLASTITEIYFDDGTLLGLGAISDSGAGVTYQAGANPPSLPQGNTIGFNTSPGGMFFAAEAAGNNATGVDPGEWVEIRFTLQAGKTYADTVAALNLALTNPTTDIVGGLRIGIHVRAIGAGGQSDSYVTGTPGSPSVPEPSTIALAGLGGLLLARRRSSRSKAACCVAPKRPPVPGERPTPGRRPLVH